MPPLRPKVIGISTGAIVASCTSVIQYSFSASCNWAPSTHPSSFNRGGTHRGGSGSSRHSLSRVVE